MKDLITIDSIDGLHTESPLTAESKSAWGNAAEKLGKMAREYDIELFLFESPYNNYIPAPTNDEFVMRSGKRRLFFSKINGQIPANIDLKNYIREEML